MSEVTKPEPVDNSHLDAGVAARAAQAEAAKAAVVEEVVDEAVEAIESEQDGEGQPQNTEESADSESGDAPAQQPKKKPGVHQRIDELTKEKHDARRAQESAERERDYWRDAATRQPAQQEQPVQAAKQESGEPTLESCNFDVAEFNRVHYQWMRNQERQYEQAQARHQKFVESETAFRADHPDYDQVVRNPALPITQLMAEEIADSDNPPAVAYYLGQNPNEAAAIAQMGERAMSRAIGRIEARLSAPPAPEPVRQPEPKTVTRAPAPVTTLSGAPAVKKSYEEMSQREYEEARRKERAAKGLT